MDNSRLSNENLESEEKPQVNSTDNNETNLKNISRLSKDSVAAAGYNVETPIVSAILGNINGTLPVKKSETEMFKCEICDCEFSSNVVLSFHINGSKHKKRLKAIEIIAQLKDGKDKGVQFWGGDNLNAFGCEICSLTVNSAQQLEIHLSGAKHKKRASKANAPDPETVKLNKDSEMIENSDNNTCPPAAKKKKKDEPTMIRCDTCNLILNSQTQFDQHKLSKKHQSKTAGNQHQRKIPGKGKFSNFPQINSQFPANQLYQNGSHQFAPIYNKLFSRPEFRPRNQFYSSCKSGQTNFNSIQNSHPPFKRDFNLS